MASSIPYDPDGFEDNNPFAEPVQHQHTLHIHSVNHADEPEEPAEADDEENPEAVNEQEGQITDKELRGLLPERYTHKYSLKLKLTAIEKNKPGNPILKFDAHVTHLPKFRQERYQDIRRTYQEIVKFNKYLTISNLECFVPQIASVTTSYPPGGDEEHKLLFALWQEWCDRVTANPIIIRDPEFVFFIENDMGYSVINSDKKASIASGILRKTLKQLPPPYDPYEDLANFRPLIKSCYVSCQKLEKLLEKHSKSEKQLATQLGQLSQKISNLSQVEYLHPGMKNMWEKLSKIKLIEADLTLVQLYNELGVLGDGLRMLTDDFYEVKEALTNRHLIMRELIQAQQHTKAKHLHANKMKNKSALDPIKVDEALRSLESATKAEESLNLQLKRITGEMLIEKDEVIAYTETKLHKLLKNYSLNKVDYHRKILKHLETIRLDIRIVDDKGGLSRLNRENLSNLKHNLPQSQSTNGDSWSSRTFRSLSDTKAEQKQTVKEDNDTDEPMDPKNAAHLLGVATF